MLDYFPGCTKILIKISKSKRGIIHTKSQPELPALVVYSHMNVMVKYHPNTSDGYRETYF
jgi:hypothetical protein